MTTETKVCGGCREEKPREAFYKDKSKRDGLTSRCRECGKAKSNAYYAANRERRADYYAANRERLLEYHAAYYAANADAIREQQAAYTASGRRAANQRARYKARADRGLCVYCASPALPDVRGRCEVHAERHRAGNARRYITARTAIVADHLEALDVPGCYLCEAPIGPDETWHVEHVVPVAHGGDEWVRVACADCNLTKGARFPGEVIEELHPEGDAIAAALESGVFTLVDAITGEVLEEAR